MENLGLSQVKQGMDRSFRSFPHTPLSFVPEFVALC